MKILLILLVIIIINHLIVVHQLQLVLKVNFYLNESYSLLISILSDNGGTIYKQYSFNAAGAVPTGSSTTSTATLVITFNTITNTYTTAAG